MQVGINAWLSAHLHICTSAHANVSTGGDDAWVAAQADASACLLTHTLHLEPRIRKEGAAHWQDAAQADASTSSCRYVQCTWNLE